MSIPIILSIALLLTACESYSAGFVNAGGSSFEAMRSINKAYASRDACLARNARAQDLDQADTTFAAHAVALACTSETDKLIEMSNPSDSKMAAAIRDDSELRAKRFVLRARGQTIVTSSTP